MKRTVMKPARLAPHAGPATGEQGPFEISSSNDYFRISKQKPEKMYGCTCPLCDCVGLTHITKQYTDFKDILIEDRSRRIFDPFVEKVEGF